MDKAQITILQEQIMERMDLSKQLSGEEIREMIDKQLMAEGKRRYLELAVREKIRKDIFHSIRQLGILQELIENPEITEIMVNGTEGIFIERFGKLEQTDFSFESAITAFLTRFPLTKSFYDKVAAGRFASGMYLAFTSGMDTYQSLDMISEIVENKAMADKIELCKKELLQNSNLPEALAHAEIFSNLYSRMVAVGFKSGSIDAVMKQIAQNYEKETDKQMSRIISIIEPTLVILLSLVVGIILLSVLLPLMGIMSSIG